MNVEPPASRSIHPLFYKVMAWVCWSVFLLASVGLFAVAAHEKNDTYFVAYYGHHPMSPLTVVMITFPVWITMLPSLWLPFVIVYQRQNQPRGIVLVPLILSMLMAAMVVFVLMLFSGPPIEM